MYCFRPPGVFEFENFKKGTVGVMDAVVSATQRGATTIIGNDSGELIMVELSKEDSSNHKISVECYDKS
jgi:phosphoglycerate kinase